MAFRTQKISQMTPKGADLEATDLIEVSTIESGSYVTRSITGQEIIDAAVGNVDWGDIGGTLSAQTDLQSALDAKVPTSRTLTINGVTQDLSADRTFTISTGITIGSTAIASGTVGRVLFQGTGNVVQQSSSLFWDATNNRLGIGTSSPFWGLHYNVDGGLNVGMFSSYGTTSTFESLLYLFRSRGTSSAPSAVLSGDNLGSLRFAGQWGSSLNEYTTGAKIEGVATQNFSSSVNSARMSFYTTADGSNVVRENMRLFSSGNLLLQNGGTFTDAGFRLDVNGTARVSGTLTLNNTSGTNRSTDIRTSNSIDNFPTTTFYPSSGTNVGQSFQVIPRGTGFSAGIKAQFAISGTDTIADGTNFEAMVVRATGSAFTFSSGKGGTGTIRPMLFSAGFLDGVTNPNQLWLYSTGNIGINTTTDAGFRLDVNGTQRILGNLTISAGGVGTNTFNANINYLFANQNNVYGLVDLQNAAGQSELFRVTAGYSISSGTTSQFILSLRPTYNFTGTYAGIVRGFYYNPTLTSVTGVDHRAIETTSGRVIFGGLPTSSAGLPTGAIWNDAGTLKIV